MKSYFDSNLTRNVDKEILAEIVKLFVAKEKQSRFLEFLSSTKRYVDFQDELLNDPRHFDPDCIIEIPGNEHTFEGILNRLKSMGAGNQAYLLSGNWDSDGTTGKLEELLLPVVGNGGDDLVYCVSSRLAFYEGHENWRYILRRK